MHVSKGVIAMRWKQDESGTGEGVLTFVKPEANSNTITVSNNILLWRKFRLTSTRDLGFKCLVVGMALC